MPSFPQDGSPIDRDAWLGTWPRSKKGNEWVRAFGVTYTIKPCTFGRELEDCAVTVVGLGGRTDLNVEGNERDVKEWLWIGAESRPYTIDELRSLELGA